MLGQRAGDSAPGMSGRLRGEGRGDAPEQRLLGVRPAHQQPHPAGVGQHHRADLEQRQADGLRRRLRQLGRRQGHPPHPLQQGVREAAEQQAELVGVEVAGRGAVGEQAQLLVLDPVLHLPALAVHGVVKTLRVVRHVEVGDHEAGVGAEVAVLGLDHHPTLAGPGSGRVLEVVEQPQLAAVEPVQRRRGPHDRRGQPGQDAVGRQPKDVADVPGLAPAHDAPAAEAAVAPEDDLHVRPLGAQRPHQKGQDGPRPPRRVPVARLQHRRQKVAPGEHVQRQVAVVPVVAVPVAPLLHPVQRDVGRVEVQHHPLRRRRVRRDELLEQHFVQRHRLRRRRPPLEPAQRGRAGQLGVPPRRRLQRRVAAQRVVVVEVLMAQEQGEQALPHDGKGGMDHAFAPPVVADRPGHGSRQAHAPVGLDEQRDAAVGGDLRARELGLDEAPFGRCKAKDVLVAFRHGGCPS